MRLIYLIFSPIELLIRSFVCVFGLDLEKSSFLNINFTLSWTWGILGFIYISLESICFRLELTPSLFIDFNYYWIWVLVLCDWRLTYLATDIVKTRSQNIFILKKEFLFLHRSKRRISFRMWFFEAILSIISSRASLNGTFGRWSDISGRKTKKWHGKFIIVRNPVIKKEWNKFNLT